MYVCHVRKKLATGTYKHTHAIHARYKQSQRCHHAATHYLCLPLHVCLCTLHNTSHTTHYLCLPLLLLHSRRVLIYLECVVFARTKFTCLACVLHVVYVYV